MFEKLGGRTRARTWDPLIKSQLLYQLSYAPGRRPEKPSRGGSFSKATPHCPAKGRKFSRPSPGLPNSEKPLDSSDFVAVRIKRAPSEPLAAALVRPAIAIVAVAVEAMGARASVTV